MLFIWSNVIKELMENNLFNDSFVENLSEDDYKEFPFSILDSRRVQWRERKRKWKNLGIKSEIGRRPTENKNHKAYGFSKWLNKISEKEYINEGDGNSIFDPVLTEIIYKWFCPIGGKILDPFAGGSVRGIVANYLGYYYTGIELRQEQVDSNREQASNILPVDNQPQWYVGDSDKILDNEWLAKFDFIFSCPPYFNLEKYSNLPNDLSNLNYEDFLVKYHSIIKKSTRLLKKDCLAVFVVGEVRDWRGYFLNLIGNTISAFIDANLKYYNEIILINLIGPNVFRLNKFDISKKIIKIHQNILCFKKI